VAVAQMAQPNAEPVEEYEYVLQQDLHLFDLMHSVQIADLLSIAMKDYHQIFP
jgi:hypothetical protein